MTTPCIGWAAPDGCAAWGDFHGCKHDDGHKGPHQCPCGAGRKSNPPRNTRRPVAICGTDPGYYRHRDRHEAICDPCKAAHAEAERQRRANLRKSA